MTAITRTINSKGVVIVKRIGKEKGNQKVVCRCPDCGKEFATWISTFYRNINSCRCKYPSSKRLDVVKYGAFIEIADELLSVNGELMNPLKNLQKNMKIVMIKNWK